MPRVAKAVSSALAAVLVVLAGIAVPMALDAAPAGAYPAADLTLRGHGYGHGRGLGQWGAYGYATQQGWQWQQILGHFYGGTSLGSQPDAEIGVRLVYQDALELKVTASVPFTLGSVAIPAGGSGRLALGTDSAGQPAIHYAVAQSGGCGSTDVYSGITPDAVFRSSVTNPGTALGSMLTVCAPSVQRTYRGALRMVNERGTARTVNIVLMEEYLRGVVPRESPASWGNTAQGMHALNAQAVAARSYAWAENRYPYAKTCDTETCQVYLGAGQNGTTLEHPNTDAARANTWQTVLKLNSTGLVARAEFSSSTGGHTAGGTFPAVVDAGDAVSPHHDWTVTVPVATIETAYALGTLQDVQVTQRNGLGADGGRVLKVVFTGTAKTLERTGDQVRTDFALKSNWFSVVAPTTTTTSAPGGTPTTPTTAPPAASVKTWIVPGTLPPGDSALSKFPWGIPGDIVLSCDWNGDGVDSPGVYRNGQFSISNTTSTDPNGIYTFPYGAAGDTPLCGDWNGDKIDTIGIWRAGSFQLRNLNSPGPVGGAWRFGNPTDEPIVGDWNGDRADTPGVHRGDRFFLANSYAAITTDKTFVFGGSGDRSLIGDWDRNGTQEPALQRADRFYAGDGNGGVVTAFTFGVSSDRGIAGTFAPGGGDVIALVRG